MCAYVLFNFVVQDGTWKRHQGIWAKTFNSDVNWLGTYLIVVIPLLFSASICLKNSWRRLIYLVGILGPTVFVLFLTYLRSAWLAVAVQGTAFCLITGRRKLALGILGCFVLFAVGVVALPQLGYYHPTANPSSLYERLALWKLGLEEVSKHPLVGIGYGNDTFPDRFEVYFETAQLPLIAGARTGLHNAFLMVAMGSGVPALIFLVWVLVTTVRALLSGAEKASSGLTSALMVGVALMVIGFAVRNFFDYMFAGSLAYLFWILVAAGVAQSSEGQRTQTRGVAEAESKA